MRNTGSHYSQRHQFPETTECLWCLLAFCSLFLFTVGACSGKTTQQQYAERNLALLEEAGVDPDFAKGRALVLEERFSEALPYLEKSSEPEALFFRALALHALGNADEAAGLFAICIQNNIQPVESLYNLGLIAYEKGDSDSAVARMEEVLEKAPEHAGAHYFLGSAAYAKNDMPSAEKHFRMATIHAPRIGAAWEGLFYALVSQDNLAEGWDLRDRLDRAAGDNLLNLLLIGEKLGKAAEALALIPAGEVSAPVRLQRIILVAQVHGLAAAIAESDNLPKEVTASAEFIVLDRGTTGALEIRVLL